MLAYQNKKPLVSVCIPTYNAEKTVGSTLQSLLNQTYQNLEIIIVNNASTDNTSALLQQFTDQRIKIYKNSKNIGAGKNWDRCIELASGEYIDIFHADDLYKPDMVEKQVQAFQDNPSVGAVFTMNNRINDRGEVTGKGKLPVELKGKGIYYFPEIFISILRTGNFLMTPSAMVRSEIYKELAPFNYERFESSVDLDMWLRIVEKHPIAILDEKLMSYRVSNEIMVKIGESYFKVKHTPESHWYRHLPTEEANFFKVMDCHLSAQSDVLNIPHGALAEYEFQRALDRITRAVNHLIKAQPEEAKRLLKQSLSTTIFGIAVGNIRKPKLIAYWLSGIILLISVYLGLGSHLGKSFHWLIFRWRRRRLV